MNIYPFFNATQNHTVILPVVGTSFVAGINKKIHHMVERDTVFFTPEPSNPVDKDAVMIMHPVVGKLGYLSAQCAQDYHKGVARGYAFDATITCLYPATGSKNAGIRIQLNAYGASTAPMQSQTVAQDESSENMDSLHDSVRRVNEICAQFINREVSVVDAREKIAEILILEHASQDLVSNN